MDPPFTNLLHQDSGSSRRHDDSPRHGGGAEATSGLLHRKAMHCMPDGLNVSVSSRDVPMSIFGTMHALAKLEKSGEQQRNFKESIIQWSTAYGVTYALILTISFSLLIQQPRQPPDEPSLSFLRPRIEWLDVSVLTLFYWFGAISALDSAWGMLLCAEWGVRAVAVPAGLFEEFIANLSPFDEEAESLVAPQAMWSFRFLEPRAVHPGLPRKGLFTKEDDIGVGFIRSASWDPFYFIDRSVQSLFLSTICLVYLNRGLLPMLAVSAIAVLLWLRIKWFLKSVVSSLFKTLAVGQEEARVSNQALRSTRRSFRKSASVNAILAAAAKQHSPQSPPKGAAGAGKRRWSQCQRGLPAVVGASTDQAEDGGTPPRMGMADVVSRAVTLAAMKKRTSFHLNSRSQRDGRSDTDGSCRSSEVPPVGDAEELTTSVTPVLHHTVHTAEERIMKLESINSLGS
ncbi:hypothetical protein AB1Y20_011623 [Prymnesium parvum]|uniref:Glycerophosphocholine acyltransferase 1 n=1 Tax=Prymnesium parvum TaxID=97485 RepID=A0AB34IHY7_PRYPA